MTGGRKVEEVEGRNGIMLGSRRGEVYGKKCLEKVRKECRCRWGVG